MSGPVRHAWRGSSLLGLDLDGWCGEHPLSGFFFREARHLSRVRLELFGEAPRAASLADGTGGLEATFLHPPVDRRRGGGTGSGGGSRRHGVLARGLDLAATWAVRPASLEVRIRVTSRWDAALDLDLAWDLAADFADLQQAVAGEDGFGSTVEADGEGLVLRCVHPELPLATRVRADGAHWRWTGERLETRATLLRQEPLELVLCARAEDRDDPLDDAAEAERTEALRSWRASVARITVAGDGRFAERVNGAMDDLGSLALLDGPREEWLAPAAGVPHYPAFFGRDALTAGWQATVLDGGELLGAAERKACRLLGRREDAWRDEQPGRVVQQARRGPLARLGRTPFDRYYGDYAAPLMFVIALGQRFAWSGDRRALARSWPHAMRALYWAERHGDVDGDGYLEYVTASPEGPKHQGWKDSDNAVVDASGAQVEPPFAACELQGYWFAALQIASVLAALQGKLLTARRLWSRARDLRRRFDRDFWLDEEGIVAFGLDAAKRPVRSATSNAGQCLATGILRRRRVRPLARRLLEPDLFSGWGVRTLSNRNPSYNPLSYHLGTVWPVENATVLMGFRRYGLDGPTLELAGAMRDLADLWSRGRVPECVGGHPRDGRGHPGAYPHANAPQAWNQSAWPLILQVLLGLQPMAPLRALAVDPLLPEWLPELELHGLRVGRARVDLAFRRKPSGRTRWRVLRRRGPLRVVRQPPVDDLSAGLLPRLRLGRLLLPPG